MLHPENFQLDKIQNGQISTIIRFITPYIWQTVLDS